MLISIKLISLLLLCLGYSHPKSQPQGLNTYRIKSPQTINYKALNNLV